MTGILHQQTTSRCRDEISRNGETGPGPCDRLKEIETVLPFTHHLGPHQLPIKAGPSKAECLGSPVKMDNRTEPVRDLVSALTSD